MQRNVAWQQDNTEDDVFFVHWSQKQKDLAIYWCRHEIHEPLDEIPHDAKGREVRDVDDHMGFSDLQGLYDAHAIISDVDSREALRDQSCEDAAT